MGKKKADRKDFLPIGAGGGENLPLFGKRREIRLHKFEMMLLLNETFLSFFQKERGGKKLFLQYPLIYEGIIRKMWKKTPGNSLLVPQRQAGNKKIFRRAMGSPLTKGSEFVTIMRNVYNENKLCTIIDKEEGVNRHAGTHS